MIDSLRAVDGLHQQKEALERLRNRYNRREFVHPDPVEFLYRYEDVGERELVALVASSLAYGRVNQIIKSVSQVLGLMEPSPYQYVMKSSPASLGRTFSRFKHRFTTGDDIAGLLGGARRVIEEYGSLNTCFNSAPRSIDTLTFEGADSTVVPALCSWVEALQVGFGPGYLLPSPRLGSACKRLNLFLRWMVRRDEVDPGGWEGVSASRLVVPLDTHMHRISLALGITTRKQADMRTALEITRAFRRIAPGDPTRYDFAITRLGIRDDCDPEELFPGLERNVSESKLVNG